MLACLITFAIGLIVTFLIHQKYSNQRQINEYHQACKDGEKYRNLTIATIALIEDAYLKA